MKPEGDIHGVDIKEAQGVRGVATHIKTVQTKQTLQNIPSPTTHIAILLQAPRRETGSRKFLLELAK